MKKKILLSVIAIGMVTSFTGCGSSDDDNDVFGSNDTTEVKTAPATKTGFFVDSAVGGLNYETTSGITGETNSLGAFDFKDGDVVSFYVGSVKLGAVTPEENKEGNVVVTPTDISENEEEETKVLKFLQSLDADGNPENGISIPKEVVDSLKAKQKKDIKELSDEELVSMDETLKKYIDKNGDGKIDVDTDEARQHYTKTKRELEQIITELKQKQMELEDYEIKVLKEKYKVTDGDMENFIPPVDNFCDFVASGDGVPVIKCKEDIIVEKPKPDLIEKSRFNKAGILEKMSFFPSASNTPALVNCPVVAIGENHELGFIYKEGLEPTERPIVFANDVKKDGFAPQLDLFESMIVGNNKDVASSSTYEIRMSFINLAEVFYDYRLDKEKSRTYNVVAPTKDAVNLVPSGCPVYVMGNYEEYKSEFDISNVSLDGNITDRIRLVDVEKNPGYGLFMIDGEPYLLSSSGSETKLKPITFDEFEKIQKEAREDDGKVGVPENICGQNTTMMPTSDPICSDDGKIRDRFSAISNCYLPSEDFKNKVEAEDGVNGYQISLVPNYEGCYYPVLTDETGESITADCLTEAPFEEFEAEDKSWGIKWEETRLGCYVPRLEIKNDIANKECTMIAVPQIMPQPGFREAWTVGEDGCITGMRFIEKKFLMGADFSN